MPWLFGYLQYIPRNMHTVFALLCFVVVIHWLLFPYPSGLLHWHCGNLTIAPVPAKQPWWIWINTSCEFIINDCITTTKQSTTKLCAYFLGYTIWAVPYLISPAECCRLRRETVRNCTDIIFLWMAENKVSWYLSIANLILITSVWYYKPAGSLSAHNKIISMSPSNSSLSNSD